MTNPSDAGSFDARPDSGIFRVIRHLNYKAQYAFAEFIDNSISSYEENKTALRALDPNYRLRIEIEIGDGKITVRDNAAGIPRDQYARAFKTAEPPKDPKKGLNEFGMGMKTASIWLSNFWKVVSSSIEDNQKGTVVFDVNKMIEEKTTIIKPTWSPKTNSKEHGTTIVLEKLNRSITSLPTVKAHLAEIYRCYLRSGEVDIRIFRTEDDENSSESIIKFEELPALFASAHYPYGPKDKVTWEKKIDVKLPTGHRITGQVKILEKGSTTKAGLYLFRRNRLIIGASEPYRPIEIFGRSNSFPYQRIYGELHLEGYEVTHTKDDIIWGSKGDDEATFIKEVKKAIQGDGLNLIMQALNYRAKFLEDNKDLQKTVEKENIRLEEEIKDKKEDLINIVEEDTESVDQPAQIEPAVKKIDPIGARKFTIVINEENWIFDIIVDKNSSDDPLFRTETFKKPGKEQIKETTCKIYINANNRFARNYLNRDEEFYEVILRFAVASSFAKARCDAVRLAYTNSFLRYMNESLTLLDGSTKNT